MFRAIFREPLLHFLLIAGVFFLVYGWFNPVGHDDLVEVSQARIQQLRNHFYRTWQRQPTTDEMAAMVNDFVLDEIYVREARSLGLDQDDEIIRRRLRQKMEFLTEDSALETIPDDAVLEAFMRENPEHFARPARYTFRQIYINPDKHTGRLQAWLTEQQQRIDQGQAPQGDRSLSPGQMAQAPAFDVMRQFGDDFVTRLDALPLGQWSGPVPSGLGLHFVYLEQREPGLMPALGQVRDRVLAQWQYRQRQQRMREHEAALLQQYRVRIDWPAGK